MNQNESQHSAPYRRTYNTLFYHQQFKTTISKYLKKKLSTAHKPRVRYQNILSVSRDRMLLIVHLNVSLCMLAVNIFTSHIVSYIVYKKLSPLCVSSITHPQNKLSNLCTQQGNIARMWVISAS